MLPLLLAGAGLSLAGNLLGQRGTSKAKDRLSKVPVPAQLIQHHELGNVVPVFEPNYLADPHSHEADVCHRSHGDLPKLAVPSTFLLGNHVSGRDGCRTPEPATRFL